MSQVFALGRTSFQNLIDGMGTNPRGGISSLPVANVSTSPSVVLQRPAEQKTRDIINFYH